MSKMKALGRCSVLSCCILAAASLPAFGEGRIFLLPAGVPPTQPSGPYTVDGTAGQDIVFDVWLEQTGTCDVRSQQVWFDCQATGGDVGQIVFVSDAIDENRTDYIYYGLSTLTKVEHPGNCPTDDPMTEGPRTSQACTDVYPFVTDPVYLSTWTFHIDADAKGTFTLRPYCPVIDGCQFHRTNFICGAVPPITPPFDVDTLIVEIPVNLVSSTPAHDKTLWRSANNIARLTFDGTIALPGAGEVLVQELLDGGAFGADLSGSLSFTVEGGNILKIVDTASVLTHRKWYAIHNTGGWSGVAPFAVHYVVQMGDCNNDTMVLPNDLSCINSDIPNMTPPDDSRFEINGDGMVLPNDLSAANSFIPSMPVTKPPGH